MFKKCITDHNKELDQKHKEIIIESFKLAPCQVKSQGTFFFFVKMNLHVDETQKENYFST